jgi:hypothetical protein
MREKVFVLLNLGRVCGVHSLHEWMSLLAESVGYRSVGLP